MILSHLLFIDPSTYGWLKCDEGNWHAAWKLDKAHADTNVFVFDSILIIIPKVNVNMQYLHGSHSGACYIVLKTQKSTKI